jgi:hypothetical protein
MKIVGCDLHARQQTLAMMDMENGEITEKTLATGAMQWFLELLEELGISRLITRCEKAVTALAPRVRWHQVVRTVVDHKLAIVLAAVLDGKHPDVGVVGQPAPKSF